MIPPTSASGNSAATPAYPSFPISKLVGIEPSEGMRESYEKGTKILSEADPKATEGKVVTALSGDFADFSKVASLGIEKGSVDAVIIAQAWHWCPDYEAALVGTCIFTHLDNRLPGTTSSLAYSSKTL